MFGDVGYVIWHRFGPGISPKRIWDNLGKNWERIGKKWEKVGKSGEKWEKVGKSGKKWGKVGQFGKIGKISKKKCSITLLLLNAHLVIS